MINNWLDCEISQGQFTGEYAVKARMFDDTEFSLFVPRECLKFNEEPTHKSVSGKISVLIAAKKNDLVMVELPRPTFENGRSVTVKESQLASE